MKTIFTITLLLNTFLSTSSIGRDDNLRAVNTILNIIAENCEDEQITAVFDYVQERIITSSSSGYGDVSCQLYFVGPKIRLSECRSGRDVQEHSLRTLKGSPFGESHKVVRNEDSCVVNK